MRAEKAYVDYLYRDREHAVAQGVFLVAPAGVMALAVVAVLFVHWQERVGWPAALLIALVATTLAIFANAFSWSVRPGLGLLLRMQRALLGRWLLWGVSVAVNLWIAGTLHAAWVLDFKGGPELGPFVWLLAAVGTFLGAIYPGLVLGWHLPLGWVFDRVKEFVAVDRLEAAADAQRDYDAQRVALVAARAGRLSPEDYEWLQEAGHRAQRDLQTLDGQLRQLLTARSSTGRLESRSTKRLGG